MCREIQCMDPGDRQMKTKDSYIADRGVSAITQLQNDPNLVADGYEVTHSFSETTVSVRFKYAPEVKEEKKPSIHDIPVDEKLAEIGREAVKGGILNKPPLVELKEKDFATGGIVEKPGRIFFGNYTPENDQETIGDLYYNILDHLKTGIPEEIVIVFNGNLIADHIRKNAYQRAFPNSVDGEWPNIRIGGSTESSEAGKVAGTEKHVTRKEDAAAGGERDKSPKS
jgi:hypothetical protein